MEALWEAQETTLDEMETLTRKLEREQQLTRSRRRRRRGNWCGRSIFSCRPRARTTKRANYRITSEDRLGVGSLKQEGTR